MSKIIFGNLLCRNNALRLGKNRHVTYFNQSQWNFILIFDCDIGSWGISTQNIEIGDWHIFWFLTLFIVEASYIFRIDLFSKNGPITASFFVYFRSFKQTKHFYSKSMWKNIHPVYGVGIRTHNLSSMSSHP